MCSYKLQLFLKITTFYMIYMETTKVSIDDEWIKKFWYVYDGILVSHKKRNSATRGTVDEPWRNYAKWNKSDGERQIQLG